jgi:hypothetical protein
MFPYCLRMGAKFNRSIIITIIIIFIIISSSPPLPDPPLSSIVPIKLSLPPSLPRARALSRAAWASFQRPPKLTHKLARAQSLFAYHHSLNCDPLVEAASGEPDTYVCMFVSIYVCMYACMHVYMYVCTYVYTYVHTYVYTYVCMHIYIRMFSTYISVPQYNMIVPQ